LSERVWDFLRVKHILYLFLAAIFLWRGYAAGSMQLLVIGSILVLLAVLSDLFSRGSMSFEAKLLALILSAISTVGVSNERSSGEKRLGKVAKKK